MTISKNFERFQYFNFGINFLKNEDLFQETEVPFFCWKYWDCKRNIPIKAVLSEANVKTNRMGGTKWTYHKERSFASNYFIYLFIYLFENFVSV